MRILLSLQFVLIRCNEKHHCFHTNLIFLFAAYFRWSASATVLTLINLKSTIFEITDFCLHLIHELDFRINVNTILQPSFGPSLSWIQFGCLKNQQHDVLCCVTCIVL